MAPKARVAKSPSSTNVETDRLYQSLESDRLIRVFVGERTKPLLVQPAILSSASEYFTKAIKNEHLGAGNVGVLRFPEDEEAWKVTFFWIFNRKLPSSCSRDDSDKIAQSVVVLIQCWLIGDQYLMPDFQNEIMLSLIWSFEYQDISVEAASVAFHGTNNSSPLRRIAAESLLEALTDTQNQITRSDLRALDGATELAESLLDAQDVCKEYDSRRRFDATLEYEDIFWKSYMVEHGALPRLPEEYDD